MKEKHLTEKKKRETFEASKQGKKREVKVYLYNNCNGYQPNSSFTTFTTSLQQSVIKRFYFVIIDKCKYNIGNIDYSQTSLKL